MVDSKKFIRLIGLGIAEVSGSDSYLDLGVPDIEEIGRDHYHRFKDVGVSLLYRDRKLVNAQFYNGKNSDFKPFVGMLPLELNFDFSKSDVKKQAGEPDKTTGSPKSNWDIYYSGGKAIHIQYDIEGSEIVMVTIQEQF